MRLERSSGWRVDYRPQPVLSRLVRMARVNAVSFYRNMGVEEICQIVTRAGYDSLEVSRIPFFEELTTSDRRRAFIERAKDIGLSLYGFDAWVDFDPYLSRENTLRGFDSAISFSSDLELGQIIAHDGQIEITQGRSPEQCLSVLVPFFREVADRAGEVGLRVVLEPHPDTLSMDDSFAVDLIDGIERENVGLVYDCCHYGVGQPETYLQAIERLNHRIHHIHYSDGDKATYALHLPPGKGSLDLDAIVEALKAIGFGGTLTHDLYNCPNLEQEVLRSSPKIREVEDLLELT
jgi:2-keto-myo-inositol isomerase